MRFANISKKDNVAFDYFKSVTRYNDNYLRGLQLGLNGWIDELRINAVDKWKKEVS